MKARYFIVIKEYKSPYPDPIVFQEVEQVKIGEEFKEDPEWRNWVWCEGKDNKKAWVPKQYVKIDGAAGTFNKFYNAMELSVQVGEELLVNEIINGFGMSTKTDGAKGRVPMKNMELKAERETRLSRNAKHDLVQNTSARFMNLSQIMAIENKAEGENRDRQRQFAQISHFKNRRGSENESGQKRKTQRRLQVVKGKRLLIQLGRVLSCQSKKAK